MEDPKENNNKEIAEKREEREKEDKVSEDLKLVIDMAKIKCVLCTNPEGILKVNFDTPTTQDKLTATVVEKDFKSLIFTGTCTKSPNSAAPCASVMQLGEWKDVGTVKVQDQFPLLKKSTIPCNYGGSTIEITDSGQKSEPAQVPPAAPLPKKDEPYKCKHCEEEFTSALILDTIGLKKPTAKQTEIIDSILPYLNSYRKDFGLDTCLRKAHFVAQIGVESANFKTFSEYEDYSNPPGVFSSKAITIDDTIVKSLKDNLTSIFKIVDAKGAEVAKTNDQLSTLLLSEKPTIVDKQLYAKYSGEADPKDKKKRNDKLLKTVLKADKTVDYHIYLKPHTHFGVPLMSRAYAPYPGDKRGLGNGDELTRDGWKFKGRGLKQLTGRGNYVSFTNYRNKNTFTGDTSGAIDFTEEKPGAALQGKYLLLSDNAMYATQSALYFWNDGTKKNKKFAKDHAQDDNIDMVINCVNQYDGAAGKKNRKSNYARGKAKGVFDIIRHFDLMLQNGNEAQKIEAKAYLEKQKAAKDPEATKILEEYEKKNPPQKK